MSSEGSVTSTGSRIRQFGLYRTIDARTNEFLKSSRKRQIRQGCACAAISTAITVTVVVSVILVYEYSINSEISTNKKSSMRPKWLGLMNESDLTKIDSKFTKKINFDRTTLKLLPVLLKALNKNRYLEKIIEDYASSSPTYYEKTDETENYVKKNIFADTKNWLKMPSSKLYTVDSKTTPLIYIKPSSQRLDYLSRVRKIRNYERMINYFDRMINDKFNSIKQNQEFKLDLEITESPLNVDTTHKMTNINKTRSKLENNISIKKQKISKTIKPAITTLKPLTKVIKPLRDKKQKKEGVDCKCPSNMGLLLNKLILSLQELVPYVANKQLGKSTCGSKIKSNIQKSNPSTKVSVIKPLLPDLFTESTKRKVTVESIKNESIPANAITVIQTEFKNNKIPFTKDTTLPPSTIMKADETTETTIQGKILCLNKDSTGTEKTAYSSTNAHITTAEGNQLIIGDKPTHADYTTSATPTIVNIKPHQKNEDTQFTTKNIAENPFQPFKNSSSSIIITASATPEERSHKNSSSVQSTTSAIESLSNYEKYEINSLEIASQSIIQPTTPLIISTTKRKTTTELIVPFKFNDPYIESSASTENLLDSMNVNSPIIPLFKDEEYEDYFVSTQRSTTVIDNNEILGLESVKNRMLAVPTKIESRKFTNAIPQGVLKSKASNYYPVLKNKDMLNLRNMARVVYVPNPIDENNAVTKITNLTDNNSLLKKRKFTDPNITSHSPLSFKKSSGEIEIKSSPNLVTDLGTNENIGEDEFQDEWVKQPENIELPIAFNKTHISFLDDENTATSLNEGDKSKPEHKINSMLPPNRPTYLEVRRNNEWKADEHADYDVNLANNIFDLPNI